MMHSLQHGVADDSPPAGQTTGVGEMTRETEDRMFVVFGGVFVALLLACWACLVLALI